ncbi:MAG: hypothetical protein IPN42_16810 [Methylococcaceae bacterium]|nr:hypothetical protein [Methylococcaceae bacterium]
MSEVHGILTGTTDYIGRGYTKSNSDFAIQGNLDYQHESGVYMGASASNVNFGDRYFADSAKVEFAPYFGFTHELTKNHDWRVDVQWTRYLYDGKIFGRDADYNEFYLFVHYRDLLTLRAGISDNFYNQNAITGDYEGTLRYPITDYLQISSSVGYSQVEKVLEYDYLYWNAGLTAYYKFISADLRYLQSFEATNSEVTSWQYDPEFLHATVVFSLSVGF